MQHNSSTYILGFSAAVCGVCSIVVAGAAVSLRDRQEANATLDRQKKVLTVAGLIAPGESPEPSVIETRFRDNIKARVVALQTGAYVDDIDADAYDQRAAKKDPEQSEVAPKNDAQVDRIPEHALVYQVVQGGEVTATILPVEGKGLWSTLYGYLALGDDLNTIKGLTFYEHGETPGLGGEVDNPKWKALWPGRKLFGDDGQAKIEVVKGVAGPVAEAPHKVDGLSGATITSRGVTYLVRFWVGQHGFGPYLTRLQAARS